MLPGEYPKPVITDLRSFLWGVVAGVNLMGALIAVVLKMAGVW